MPQYCVYFKLARNNSSWSKYHVSANSSDEAIIKTVKPLGNYRELTVLGAPLTSEKRDFEKLHCIK